MKKKLIAILIICCAIFVVAPAISAHELWVEVKEEIVGEEVRIDIFWGHIRDFYDEANYQAYQLFVQTPNGEVQELDLEPIGVLGRAYLQLTEEGEYVFWALRNPGIYRPNANETALSNQMAKTVFVHGQSTATESSSRSTSPVGMPLEIVPETGIAEFSLGTLASVVYLDGEGLGDVTIHAYGPAREELTATSAEDGSFQLELNSAGTWLIKANTRLQQPGDLAGVAYDFESQTTTFVVNTAEAEDGSTSEADSTGEADSATEGESPSEGDSTTETDNAGEADNIWEPYSGEADSATEAGSSVDISSSTLTMVALFIAGLLIGSAVTLVIAKRRS